MTDPTAVHWDRIYREKAEAEMSWTEADPTASLELLASAGLPPGARVLDVGGGLSPLAGLLLDRGYTPGVLDISGEAIERHRARLGERAEEVEWIRGSVTGARPAGTWDAWHDRALFHFLVDEVDRDRYLASLDETVTPGGVVVLGTFGPDGPDRCSGLPVRRYGPDTLAEELGPAFAPEEVRLVDHHTPWGAEQRFLFARFRRAGAP